MVTFMTNKNIRCVSCKFAKKDVDASEKKWIAFMCDNSESEYYKSLLNIDPFGNKLGKITWKGCKYGERRGSR